MIEKLLIMIKPSTACRNQTKHDTDSNLTLQANMDNYKYKCSFLAYKLIFKNGMIRNALNNLPLSWYADS